MQFLKSTYSDIPLECTINHPLNLIELRVKIHYREHSWIPGKQLSLAFVVCVELFSST